MQRIPLEFKGSDYFFEKLIGSLMKRQGGAGIYKEPSLSSKSALALSQVRDPYLLKERHCPMSPEKISFGVRLYAKILTWLCKKAFPLACLWSKVTLRCYPDAGVATAVYYKIYPGDQQRDLCLPRAFFARSTSKKFKGHGVMFVGAFLPSVQMHAWVIEEGMHADVWDGNWINFAPVALFE